MKTFFKKIANVLLCAAMLSGFTACSSDSHVPQGGVAVAIDNSSCSDVAVGQIKLYVYDTSGDLVTTYDFDNAKAIASVLLPLEAGQYKMAAIVNADRTPAETSTLTALHEWAVAESAADADLISGVADADVKEMSVTRVTIPCVRGSFSLPVLTVQLIPTESELADFTPEQTQARAAEAGYKLRCVAELRKAGTDVVVLHKEITPTLLPEGLYELQMQVCEGEYDMNLWADYAVAEAALTDKYYDTESLKAVKIITEPYVANTDAKDTAYGNKSGISVPAQGAIAVVELERPLAKYRIIVDAEEIAEYQELRRKNPNNFPAIEEMTVSIAYEGYFPSSFNILTGKPNDALLGISYSRSLADFDSSAEELELGNDWILVNGTSSFVNATVKITDSKGKTVCSTPGVQIDYRRNQLTTIKGKFLTSGVNNGGIRIDTEWDGEYEVWF